MDIFNDPIIKTKLLKDETVLANIKQRKTRFTGFLMLHLLIIGIFTLCLFSVKPDDIMFIVYLLFASIAVMIGLFFSINNYCRTRNSVYIITNQRIIIKEFILFKYYAHNFKYSIVEDITIRKNEILNYYDVTFIFDLKKASYGIESRRADERPKLIALKKEDLDILVSCLNKYGSKKKVSK